MLNTVVSYRGALFVLYDGDGNRAGVSRNISSRAGLIQKSYFNKTTGYNFGTIVIKSWMGAVQHSQSMAFSGVVSNLVPDGFKVSTVNSFVGLFIPAVGDPFTAEATYDNGNLRLHDQNLLPEEDMWVASANSTKREFLTGVVIAANKQNWSCDELERRLFAIAYKRGLATRMKRYSWDEVIEFIKAPFDEATELQK